MVCQRVWRYYRARSFFLRYLELRHGSATKIQAMFRGRRVMRWHDVKYDINKIRT
jgi:hypothetical protein